jgi:hypothetical protein
VGVSRRLLALRTRRRGLAGLYLLDGPDLTGEEHFGLPLLPEARRCPDRFRRRVLMACFLLHKRQAGQFAGGQVLRLVEDGQQRGRREQRREFRSQVHQGLSYWLAEGVLLRAPDGSLTFANPRQWVVRVV